MSDDTLPPDADRANRPENTTAEEEIQRFKRVPVVGRLPWNRQYLIVAVALGLAVLVLIQQAFFVTHRDVQVTGRMRTEIALRQAVSDIQAQLPKGLSADGLDSAALTTRLNDGDGVMTQLGAEHPPVREAWDKFHQSAQGLSQIMTPLAPLGQTARTLAATLDQQMAPLERPAKAAGDANVTAVYQDLLRWQAAAGRLANEGHGLSPQAWADRSDMEARLRAFYATPTASTDPHAPVWNAFLQVFGQVKPGMDQLLGNQGAWQQGEDALLQVNKDGQGVLSALGQIGAEEVASAPSHAGVWLSGLIAALCLGLLIWIGWKQQHLQALQARADAERLEAGVLDMGQQLHQVGRGNLTVRSKVTESILEPLAEIINQTVQELRSQVLRTTTATNKTAAASSRAETASSALAEDARHQAQGLTTSSQDIITIIRALRSTTAAVHQISATTEQVRLTVETGVSSVQEANASLQEVHNRGDDALNKSRRLNEGQLHAVDQALALINLAEQIGLLAVQADLHAARAGEQGRGFAVVADGMRDLANQTSDAAKRLHGMMETGRSEVEGVLAAIDTILQRSDNLARLNDVNQEAWQSAQEQLERTLAQSNDLAQRVQEQQPVAESLEHRTQESLAATEQTRQRIQDVRLAAEEQAQVVHELGESIRRFQV